MVESDDADYRLLASRAFEYIVPCKLGLPDPMLNQSGVSPAGSYVVTIRSRSDQLLVNLLLDRSGKALLTLEDAEVSGLPKNWQWPEPVQLTAADNQTVVYGLIFRPSDFSPEKSYPIIDYSKCSADLNSVPKSSFANAHYLQAAMLAELGFIVVVIDGRGTPYREKSFVDASYGWCPSMNFTEDRIVGIKQLAKRYPYMDLNRVGTMATNANISAVYSLLEHPKFYKVGVSQGFSDPQLLSSIHGEYFEGITPNSKGKKRAEDLAGNLQGKLLLMHGMKDAMSHPAGTFRLIEALQKANKDFDLLLLPNDGCSEEGGEHIGSKCTFRRTWDYFFQHLLSIETPKKFDLENDRS